MSTTRRTKGVLQMSVLLPPSGGRATFSEGLKIALYLSDGPTREKTSGGAGTVVPQPTGLVLCKSS